MTKPTVYLKQKDFFPSAKNLRAEFETCFKNPLAATEDRFCWDLWHVPNQYHLLRTPAWQFFSAKLYRRLHLDLIAYGQKNLGCHGITPPWLSLYVDGCGQSLHADVPHGPWAFVYSLTLNKRIFTGGETTLLRQETLDYWPSLIDRVGQSTNVDDITLSLAPNFNQLLVFDPKIPHGVSEVRGVKDPMKGRLVIHGWFQQPAPFVTGGLERRLKSTSTVLNEVIDQALTKAVQVTKTTGLYGTIVFKISISPSGKIKSISAKTKTLRTIDRDKNRTEQLVEPILTKELGKAMFPIATKPSQIILPIVFDY